MTDLHDLTDRAATEEQVAGIAADNLATLGMHELKTRKTGDMILADVHLEIDGSLTVAEGHGSARQAKLKVMARHPVLYLMAHVDPVAPGAAGRRQGRAGEGWLNGSNCGRR